jgi:long-chain acyl-CoA synthetase
MGGLGTLGSVIEGLFARGGRSALVAFGEQGVEIWSYRGLAGRVRLLARGLRGVGVERGDHVSIVFGNRPEWVAACLAVISAGAVVVPADVQTGDDALGYVLKDSGAQLRRLRLLGRTVSAVSEGMFLVNRAIMRGSFRLRAEGLENLPEGRQFIVAPNHVSYLCAFVAAALPRDVRRRTHWAGWTGAAFGKLLTRLVSRLAQVVRVDPERAGLSSLAFGAAVLGRGRNLVWLAEGERSRTGSLQPSKPGVGMILDHYPVPVVPVFVRGTYEARPRGRFLRTFEKVSVTCGEPFDPRGPDKNAETREQVVEVLRGRVFELGQRR